MYRLIALDLDGTCLTSDIVIAPSTIEAVHYARSKGVKVIVSTGRIVVEAAEFAREMGCSSALISAGGAAISDVRNSRNVREWTIPWSIGAKVVEAVQNRPVTVMIYVGNKIYLNPYSDEILSSKPRSEGFHSNKIILDDIAACIRENKFPVSKVFARGNLNELAAALGEINTLPHIHITRSAENNFEVMPEGA
ncbi:MAG: HAD hydrolase family protein, partial [Butyricicoccaceae bacterium]